MLNLLHEENNEQVTYMKLVLQYNLSVISKNQSRILLQSIFTLIFIVQRFEVQFNSSINLLRWIVQSFCMLYEVEAFIDSGFGAEKIMTYNRLRREVDVISE
jgi:hypothetical protein